MNKKKLKYFQIFSAIFVMILGTLFHFTYDISGKNTIVALFSSVNESTWEHLKFLFFPMLLTIVIGHFYLKDYVPNFICAKTIGILTSMIFTIIFFYTYSGIIGKTISLIDISFYYISVILGEYISYRLMQKKYACNNKLGIAALSIIALCFITFTFSTPKLGLFKDPITSTYGITKLI